MNVLLLTPDRVGSTLLQRLLTIYMLRYNFDKPVINLHELSNGLSSYFNSNLNQMILGKGEKSEWNYDQSLSNITELLKSAEPLQYSTSRLAHYHLVKRNDELTEQAKFYDYLNNNFFIIGCRRDDLFQYVLSWIIKSHSKVLNVYGHDEKVDIFKDLYKNKITAQKEYVFKKLDAYKEYIEWSDRYFDIQSYFKYEDTIDDIEKYILNLDFMQNNVDNTWNDMFGIDFNQWNKCHKLLPELQLSDKFIGDNTYTPAMLPNDKWNELAGPDWPEYESLGDLALVECTTYIRNEIETFTNAQRFTLNKNTHEFLVNNIKSYKKTSVEIEKLVSDGFLVTGIPIKLQTFNEKKAMIKNFDECVAWVNEWVIQHNFGKLFSPDDESNSREELKFNNFQNSLK